MVQNNDRIEFFHLTSWLIKDICWFLHFKILAGIMIIPTLSLTIYMLTKTKHFFSLNTIYFGWVLMNIGWMLYEFYSTPIIIPFIFMSIGLIALFGYIYNKYEKGNI